MTKTLLMFPGQGSQYPGMAKDWHDNFKSAKLAFEEGSDGAALDLKKIIFDGTDVDLKQTEITQPAIVTATLAIFRSLEEIGKLPSQQASACLYAGHSLGEYSALVALGALSLNDATRIVRKRGSLMQAAVPAGVGAMAALIFKPGAEAERICAEICAEAQKKSGKKVSPANFNSPEQIVVAGDAGAVTAACELAPILGARKAVPLAVSAPFHCALMKDAEIGLRPALQKTSFYVQKNTYIANVDAMAYEASDGAAIQERLLKQITAPVRWTQSVQTALQREANTALEIGPGAVLTGLAKRISWQEKTLPATNIDRLEAFQKEKA